MKAVREVGIGKAFRYAGFAVVAKLLHWAIVPQLRGAVLRLFGARIDADSVVGDVSFANLHHYGFRRLSIGRRCFIGDEVMLDMRGGITLEDDVTLSNRTNVVTHINVGYADHPLQRAYPTAEQPVVFKRGVYVGTAATILSGVTVGERAVVGAGAVVTRDVAPHTVVAGVPAKVIKRIRK